MQRSKSKQTTAQRYRITQKNDIPVPGKHLRCRQRRKAAKNSQATLLWIDDYVPGLLVYSAIFEDLGFRVLTASQPRIGLDLAATEHVDAAIVDYEMPEMNGGAVAAELKRRDPQLPVVLFSGSTVFPDRLRKLADAICDKAQPIQRLLTTVEDLISKKALNPLQQRALYPTSEQGQSAFA